MKKKIRNDLILIIGILLISTVFFFLYNCKESGEYVLVYLNGNQIGKYSLNIDDQYSLNEGSNILVIKDHKAYIIEANCPDKLCVKQGKVSKSGQCLTCLPNKITIKIIGNKGVDLIS